MTEDKFEEASDDLQLAEKILELTTYIQGISTKLDSLSIEVEKIDKKFQDFDLQVGTKFTETDKKFQDFDLQVETKFTEIDKKSATFREKQSKQEEEAQEIKDSILKNNDQINLIKQEFEEKSTDIAQSVENASNKLLESVELVQQELKTELEEQNIDLNQKILDNEKSLKDEIATLSDQIQEQAKNVSNVLDMLGTGMEQLDQVTQAHTDSLNEVRDSIQKFKDKLQEIVSLNKKDQQNHFENFSRILESFNENIRTELTLTTQNLKESDIDILKTLEKWIPEIQRRTQNISTMLVEVISDQQTALGIPNDEIKMFMEIYSIDDIIKVNINSEKSLNSMFRTIIKLIIESQLTS